MYNLIDDMSNILKIDRELLNTLNDVSCALISQYLVETKQNDKDYIEIDVGYGILYIQIIDTMLKVKFKLSNDVISKTNLDKKIGYLEQLISRSLTRKLQKLYEELS